MPLENIFSSVFSHVNGYLIPITKNEKVGYPLLFAATVIGNVALGSSSVQLSALNLVKDIAFSVFQFVIALVAYRILMPLNNSFTSRESVEDKNTEDRVKPLEEPQISDEKFEQFEKYLHDVGLEEVKWRPETDWDFLFYANWLRFVADDPANAYIAYQAAAQLDNHFAERELGYMCQHGIGCEQNDDQAFQYYHLAAMQEQALVKLDTQSIQYPFSSKLQKDGEALTWLGYFYVSDKKNKQIDQEIKAAQIGEDPSKIKKWRERRAFALFESAASKFGCAEACYYIGRKRELQRKFEDACIAYRQAIAAGLLKAGYDLGKLLEERFSTKDDIREAFNSYKQAMSVDRRAAYRYAQMLQSGEFFLKQWKDGKQIDSLQGMKDKDEAILIYKKLMNKIPDAAYQYGVLLEEKSKSSSSTNYNEIIAAYKQAMDQGHLKAKRAYFNLNAQIDLDEYRGVVIFAADQGDMLAQEILGSCYEDEEEYKLAFHYYDLAVKHTSATAKMQLGRLYLSQQNIPQIDAEIQEFDPQIKQDPDALLQWREERALRQFTLAAEAGEKDAWYHIGHLYESKKQYKLSLEAYKHVWLTVDDERETTLTEVHAMYHTALVYEKLATDTDPVKDWRQARDYWKQALESCKKAVLGYWDLRMYKNQDEATDKLNSMKLVAKKQYPDLFSKEER